MAMVTPLFLLLALLGTAAAACAWILRTDGPGAEWLAEHLPAGLLRWLVRAASWFAAGETPRRPPRPPLPKPAPVDRRAPAAAGQKPSDPIRLAQPLPARAPAPVVTGPPAGPVLDGRAAIPPDHAAAHARIAGSEFENDAELLAFYSGEAAAFAGYGEAWQSHADHLLHEIGLDPAFTHVAAEFAEEVGDIANAVVMVSQRIHQVYGRVQEEVAGGLVLPYDARNWLTGEGAA